MHGLICRGTVQPCPALPCPALPCPAPQCWGRGGRLAGTAAQPAAPWQAPSFAQLLKSRQYSRTRLVHQLAIVLLGPVAPPLHLKGGVLQAVGGCGKGRQGGSICKPGCPPPNTGCMSMHTVACIKKGAPPLCAFTSNYSSTIHTNTHKTSTHTSTQEVQPHLCQLLARELAVRLCPLDLTRVALHLEVLVALGPAEAEDLRAGRQRGDTQEVAEAWCGGGGGGRRQQGR